MRTLSTLHGALLLAVAGAPPGLAQAADQFGSYSADDACYCIDSPDASIANRLVPTPIGGQSVARVCEVVGAGPGLSFSDGAFDHTVYADAQCGNGPFDERTVMLDAECAGTRSPGTDDCQPVGPRWNLQAAYAAEPVIQAATPVAVAPAGEIVTIDGVAWRKAPAGTTRTGGAAGTRIILDDAVWLQANDPVFAAQVELEAARRKAAVEAVASQSAAQPATPVAAVAPEESAESLRARQRVLIAEARERAAARAALEQNAEAPGMAAAEPVVEPVVEPDVEPVVEPAVEPAVEPGDDEASAAEAVAQASVPADDAGAAAPLSALRLPIDVRSSSSDFGYVQAMPISYDIGGGGVMLEGATEIRNQFHLMARAGIATKYREVRLGGGVHYTPPNADRLTLLLTGGLEYGVFPLENVNTGQQVDDASTGLFLTAATRLVLNPRFELEGGIGYSSFHEGDPIAFGGGFFHINDSVDLMSRFEVGDQDSFGIGVRVYY